MTNRSPVLLATGLNLVGEPKVVGATGTTVQAVVTQGGRPMPCVGFQLADRIGELRSAGGKLSIAFQPRVETFNGTTKVKLHLIDFQAGSPPELEIVRQEEATELR